MPQPNGAGCGTFTSESCTSQRFFSLRGGSDWNDLPAAFTVANDEVGIRDLVRQLVPADFVILEATGGLETPVASALAAAGIAVAIVNPRQVRDFARATGRLAKTDRLDAEVLARFGERFDPRPTVSRRTRPGARSTGYPAAPVG